MMENKITIQQFAERVAKQAGVDNSEALAVIRNLFKSVAEKLRQGEAIDLPGIGRFTLLKNSEERVNFEPDASFAADVNAPFQSFSPVELSEEYEDEPQLEEYGSEERSEPTQPEAGPTEMTAIENAVEIPDESDEKAVEEYTVEIPDAETETEEIMEVEDQTSTIETTTPTTIPPEIPVASITPPPFDPIKAYSTPSEMIEEDSEEFVDGKEANGKKRGSGRFITGLITGFVIAASIAVLAFFIYEFFVA